MSYCEEKLKGTSETNEDKKVVIQTTASQPPKADTTDLAASDLDTGSTKTDGAAVQLLDATATHAELDIDLTRAKVRPAHHMAADMDSGMNSAPLKDAPTLDPSTIVNA